MNKDLLMHYLIIFCMNLIVSAAVCKIMMPKKQTTFDVNFDESKYNTLKDQMLIFDKSLYDNKQAIAKIKTKIDTTNERIVYIQQNRYVNNPRISNLNSSDLVQLLSARYKDSIK